MAFIFKLPKHIPPSLNSSSEKHVMSCIQSIDGSRGQWFKVTEVRPYSTAVRLIGLQGITASSGEHKVPIRRQAQCPGLMGKGGQVSAHPHKQHLRGGQPVLQAKAPNTVLCVSLKPSFLGDSVRPAPSLFSLIFPRVIAAGSRVSSLFHLLVEKHRSPRGNVNDPWS